MPRSKALPGPSRLSQILKSLNQSPKPQLPPLKSLKLTLASRNDHFGARHFIKEDLPRIRYANPDLAIQIEKIPRSLGDKWPAELLLEFKNGTKSTLNVSDKWSTAIFEDLMSRAGGERWQAFKAERRVAGKEPVIPTPKVRSAQVPPPEEIAGRKGVAAALP
ncbi:uncharacterized protein FOMMEDRAFT_83782 [Fomitiporia mediterranea MF3/22]|uniref:uncharacterized protein n=1 Tax=Fomitiporia mediterranea (strain MF3/22) TaxID=694068 RepID=UPI0004408F32|nr:uncharacterized protein FOMMEDRAFT_83782 [Fomitiporia mediterranea MF3/22]EJD04502.1 hypothetical protein FOMMEDRAFT_83782 [Fomitiporia mediterranea MF3/22]